MYLPTDKLLALLVAAACCLCCYSASAKTLLSDNFNQNHHHYATVSPWQSMYCADQWSTSLNGGITPKTDHGCNCGSGCDFAVYTQGNNKCVNSQATDNLLVRGDAQWSDYTLKTRFRNLDNDTMGVVFRYQNTANYYLLMMSRDIAPSMSGCNSSLVGSRLLRVMASKGSGKVKVLASSKTTYKVGKVHGLQVTVVGDQITAHFDQNGDGQYAAQAELLFSVKDSAHKNGKIGLYAYQNGASESPCDKGGCWFDDVVVTEVNHDAITPYLQDSDKDGIEDTKDNCPKVSNPKQANYDGDKQGDACDTDADGDGLANVAEAQIGADPLDPDSDDDGVADGAENQPLADSDADGKANAVDPDSDNDGLPDGLERGVTKPIAGTDATKGHFIADQDPASQTQMLVSDTDGDGRSDGIEDVNKNGQVDECESNPTVVDTPPCRSPGARGSAGDATASGPTSADAGGGRGDDNNANRALDAGAGLGEDSEANASNAIALREVPDENDGCATTSRQPGQPANHVLLLALFAVGLLWARRNDGAQSR